MTSHQKERLEPSGRGSEGDQETLHASCRTLSIFCFLDAARVKGVDDNGDIDGEEEGDEKEDPEEVEEGDAPWGWPTVLLRGNGCGLEKKES